MSRRQYRLDQDRAHKAVGSGRDAERGTGGPGASEGDDGDREGHGCHILHVDMDAFYASVTLLDHPDLVGTPVIVGGGGGRGVVLSATYEARAFGVQAAMPMSRARRLCPTATILDPDHRRYSAVSKSVMALFADVTPLVEPLSLDEAFLDVSGAIRRLGPPARIGAAIRARVQDEQGITCSVGVAATKYLAKLASGLAKPDGLLVVPPGRALDMLHPLPVGALWGVGERTEGILHRHGLRTVGDVAHTPREVLVRIMGEATGAHLFELAWGRDPRSVVPDQAERSIGAERTFAEDVADPAVVRREILRLGERTAARLRSAGLVGRTVSIKVRFADFSTITRSRTLDQSTDVAREVYITASALFDALGPLRARIRLIGVRMEGLAAAERQERQLLLDEPDYGWRDAERAVDRASARFGAGSVRPASLVEQRPNPSPGTGSDEERSDFGP